MIILDTNVLSELMRPNPSAAVVRWIARYTAIDLCTTAVDLPPHSPGAGHG